jgi:hypothetical protein
MHNTGVETRVSEEVIRGKGWYWLAAVTSGDSFYMYVPPVSLMAQALACSAI